MKGGGGLLPPRQRLGRRGGGPFFQPHCYLAMLYINPFMTRRAFTCRGKGLSPFTGYHHPGKSGLGLKAETREECYLLVSVLSSFCTESRPTSSGCHDTGEPWPRAHSRLSPPTLISNQENAPHRVAQRPACWKQFLSWDSLFLYMSRFISSW